MKIVYILVLMLVLCSTAWAWEFDGGTCFKHHPLIGLTYDKSWNEPIPCPEEKPEEEKPALPEKQIPGLNTCDGSWPYETSGELASCGRINAIIEYLEYRKESEASDGED